MSTNNPWNILFAGHHTRKNSRLIQDRMIVTRRLPFPGALLTIQCLPNWLSSQSPLGALLKSTCLSLPEVILSIRCLPAPNAGTVHLAPSRLIGALLAA